MFGTIRKHQKWLWWVIVVLTVISFLVWFSPYSKLSDARSRGVDFGSVDGHRITQDEYVTARREVGLRYFQMTGRWPDSEASDEIESETYSWLLYCQKMQEMGIHPSSAVVEDVGRNIVRSMQRMGINSPDMLARVLENNGYRIADFERYVRHWVGVQELIATTGLAGRLIAPEEVKDLYIRQHQEWATQVLLYPASNYLASIQVTPEALGQFYTNHQSEYRIANRVQVSYVFIPLSNYLAQAEAYWAKTNLNETVEANYQRVGTNSFGDAKTPEEVRAKIKGELIRERAAAEARRVANRFASPLADERQPKPEDLQLCAQTNGLQVALSEPFEMDDPPRALGVGADFARAAFRLTPTEPFAGPLRGENGWYVLAFNKLIPSEIPPLDQIRDRVTDNYKFIQARELARQAGRMAYVTLTNGLAQGKTFDAIVAEAKLTPVTVPPFSLSTRELPGVADQLNPDMLKRMAIGTPAGKVSEFELTSEGGLVLFVKGKLPVDDAKMKADLPAFTNNIRQQRLNDAFDEWRQQEFQRGVRAPLLAARQQQRQSPGNLSSRPAAKKKS